MVLKLNPPISLKRRVKQGLESLFYWSGFAWICTQTRINPNHEAVILMYHSIPDKPEAIYIDPRMQLSPQVFERQIRFLSKYRRVISLSSLVNMLEKKQPIPSGSVVITFDDGYRDNLIHAFPILEKYNLPATLFLPTGMIDRSENMWVDELYTAFRFRSSGHLLFDRHWDLSKVEAVREAFHYMAAFFIDHIGERGSYLNTIKLQLKPTHAPSRLLLNWDEIKTLQKKYPFVEIGGHTHDHFRLDFLSQEEIEEQVAISKRRIEEELGKAVHWFSYPYSRYSKQAQTILQSHDIKGAVGDSPNLWITSGVNPGCLNRIDPKISRTHFQLKTSGVKLRK